ncbi:hypothetical protein KY289_036429 [Solanum tuberosum]|nr:hypothetical protein KY289_036429 [Solanum tuberosum]
MYRSLIFHFGPWSEPCSEHLIVVVDFVATARSFFRWSRATGCRRLLLLFRWWLHQLPDFPKKGRRGRKRFANRLVLTGCLSEHCWCHLPAATAASLLSLILAGKNREEAKGLRRLEAPMLACHWPEQQCLCCCCPGGCGMLVLAGRWTDEEKEETGGRREGEGERRLEREAATSSGSPTALAGEEYREERLGGAADFGEERKRVNENFRVDVFFRLK